MSWLNSNAYRSGYQQGLADASKQPKPKQANPLPMKTGLKSIGAINSNVFQKTFVEGYQKGYSDGMAKRSGVYQQQSQNKTTVMSSSENTFQHQIDLLKSLDNFLLNLKTSLRTSSRNYYETANDLHNQGFVEEYTARFVNEIVPNFQDTVKKIAYKIDEEDREYVQRLIKAIEERK